MPRLQIMSNDVLEQLSSAQPTYHRQNGVQPTTKSAARIVRAADLLGIDAETLGEFLADTCEGLSVRQIASRRSTSAATESRRSRSFRRRMRRALIALPLIDGLRSRKGVTVDPRSGLPLDGNGFLVSLKTHGQRFRVIPGVQEVLHWLGENESRLSSFFPGAWWDKRTGNYWLDLNRLIPTLAEALNVAVEEEQDAIYDLQAKTTIRVGRRGIAKAA
jgi:hypothetical protein